MSENKKTLLLIGGGHAHVEVLRQLAETPITDCDVALFDPSPSVWYSGMLPGVIAGHYTAAEAKINLWALCQRARVRFIEAAVVDVIADLQRVHISDGSRHFYDYLSIDVGSVSRQIPATPGAYVVPVKPIEPLLTAITERESIRSSSLNIQVVGGGAAAVEVALALAHRWRGGSGKKIGIVSATPMLDTLPPRVRATVLAACTAAGVAVRENVMVEKIEPTRLIIKNGGSGTDSEPIESQITILATGPAPAALLSKVNFELANDGNVSINSLLQSRSHKNIFAAGDCATHGTKSIPKSGVFAVRQGPVLARNLIATLRGRPLEQYKHDAQSLALISLGGQSAIATRNGFTLSGSWAWRWKDRIDRRWMTKYVQPE
jgi:selenide, water dikinase